MLHCSTNEDQLTTRHMNQTTYILGAGSIGRLWAAYLLQAKQAAACIVRPERLTNNSNVTTLTLSKTQPDGKLVQYTVDLPLFSIDTIDQPIQRLIVTTKAKDALTALEGLRAKLAPNCEILLLQNGMGSQQAVCAAFNGFAIWAGSSTDGAYLADPFEVVHAGKGETVIGQINAINDQVMLLPSFLSASVLGLNVAETKDILDKLWQKLAVNCCINGLTALYDCTNGALIQDEDKRQSLDELIAEVDDILQALGISETSVKECVYHVCRITANSYSSTHQDVKHHRITELAYMNGFLIQQAQQCGLTAPMHRQLMEQLQQRGVLI